MDIPDITDITGIDTSVTLYDVHLDTCIYNASGPRCTSIEELMALDTSDSAAVVTKSMTLAARDGNPHPRYWEDASAGVTINSTGLANMGFVAYCDLAAHYTFKKPLIFSLAGLTLQDNLKMFTDLEAMIVPHTWVEFNVSCPNIPGKPQLGYEFEDLDEALRRVSECYTLPFGVKLPPYFDESHFTIAADILNSYQNIRTITCINSIGNTLIIDPTTECTVIKPKCGFGGLGGSIIKPVALANVRKFYELTKGKDIIGCGGITTGVDVFEHVLCGATAVQLGSIFAIEGMSAFGRIRTELEGYMAGKGYSKLADFRGKLKTI